MNINIKGRRFGELYDEERCKSELPLSIGKEHRDTMLRAARRLILSDALKRGHNVGSQGNSFECCRCGNSCTLHPEGWKVVGSLTKGECGRPDR